MNIEILRQLITDVLAAGFIEGDTLLIRNHEAEIVDKALLCFVEMLPLVVPQSKERDETIAAVKQLREHLSPLLFTNPDTSHRN
jgi:hypothetical protein